MLLGFVVGLLFVTQAALASVASANPCFTSEGGPCSISGTKFNDLNANGVKDAGEPGLQGFTIYADYDGDGTKDAGEPSAVSAADGTYKITGVNNLVGGSQPTDVREVQQASWTCSYPVGTCKWSQVSFSHTTAGRNPTGKNFGNYKKGKITVVKDANPGNTGQAFTFGSSIQGFTPSLQHGQSASQDVKPGTYTVNETSIPADWELTSITCVSDDPGDTSAGNGSTATYNVKSGENITCTFHNRKKGKVTIVKQTNPDGSAQSFDFTGQIGGFSLQDGGSYDKTVTPGNYDVTESNTAGWQLSGIECSNQSSTTEGATAHVVVGAGEHVTCTYTNTQDGRVIVEKQTNPDGAADQFGFTADAPIGPFSLADGQQVSQAVDPGTYVVTESDPSALGYSLTALVCDDSESQTASTTSVADRKATVNVDPGETVKCVFTNTKTPTPPEQPPVPATGVQGVQQGTNGVATLSGPSGCISRTARISVRGSLIKKVTFYYDGKKIKTVTKPTNNAYSVKIKGSKITKGVHRVKAKVEYLATSPTKTKTLTQSLQRCGRATPKFTG